MRLWVLIGALFMAAFFVGSAPSAEDDALKTLVWGRGADSGGLDPAKEEDGESLAVCDNIYEPLVVYRGKTLEIVPCLATSWQISPDGLIYTFQLREGVRFHDGTPFNAEAVEFTFRRQYDRDHPFHNVGGVFKYWLNMGMDTVVDRVEAVDPATVRFTLKRPVTPFLHYLTMPFCYIVSPAAVKKHGDKYGTTVSVPTGTGAFKFVSWSKGDRIVLAANKAYWRVAPTLDRVIYRAIPDNATRLANLEKGEIDGMQFPDIHSLDYVRQRPQLRLASEPALNTGYLAMNTKKPPFDNVLVRRAVCHAVNKTELLRAIYKDVAVAAVNPIPPQMAGHNDDIKDYEYDPKKARDLLKEAGYPRGFKTDLWYMENPRVYMPDPKTVAEVIQADLREVGIEARLVTREWLKYLDDIGRGEHQLCLIGWGADIGDADNFFNILLSARAVTPPAQNVAFYENWDLQAVLDEAQTTIDEARRIALYKKACQIVHDDTPWLPLAHAKQIIVVRRNVRNVVLASMGKIFFAEVTKEPAR